MATRQNMVVRETAPEYLTDDGDGLAPFDRLGLVEQRADGVWLRDLGSLNGTYINSERVEGERPLKHGDEMVMGSTRAWYDDGRGLSTADLPAYQPPRTAAATRRRS